MEIGIVEQNNKNSWISTTGYRIFIVLKALLQSPKTIDELIKIVKNDVHFNKEVSADTIKIDINTLSIAGCEFVKLSDKYQLIKHPFCLNISNDEIDILNELRENLSKKLSLDEVFVLNDIYDKIISLTFDKEKIEQINNFKLLSKVNKDIFKEISNPQILNKKVQIQYFSPKFGKEVIDIIPLNISYENDKVYLIAYNYKYGNKSYFEVSRILKVNSVSLNVEKVPSNDFKVVYEVLKNSSFSFELKSYEKIIENSDDKIIIEADVQNEFMFIQRLLLLNQNFKVIEPDFFRDKLINKIKLIQKRYFNAQE